MSAPLPMPANLGQIEPPRDYFFDGTIPRLKDLLPKFHGQPGFVYAQICVQNARRAQDEGWGEIANTAIYTIRGPKGEVHCKLYAIGKSIPGQSHASGRRVCLVDDDVELITGLEIQPSVEVSDAEIPVSEDKIKAASGVSVEQRESTVQTPAGKAKK